MNSMISKRLVLKSHRYQTSLIAGKTQIYFLTVDRTVSLITLKTSLSPRRKNGYRSLLLALNLKFLRTCSIRISLMTMMTKMTKVSAIGQKVTETHCLYKPNHHKTS